MESILFLFVNPKSGGRLGLKLKQYEEIFFRNPRCRVFICDLLEGASPNKPGFLKLKELLNSNRNNSNLIRLVVSGGDGSLSWVYSELINHELQEFLPKIVLGILPFGTGNDFAHTFGWMDGCNKMNIEKLNFYVNEWFSAKIQNFDIWKVSIFFDGEIQKIKEGKKITFSVDSPCELLMFNYFSTGIESRIGIGFERNRKSNRILNKIVYGFEGFKKIFKPKINLKEIIKKITLDENKEIILQGSPSSLIFLNISSFAGGCKIWSKSPKSVETENQNFDDKKLEVLAYDSLIDFSMEQFKVFPFSGNGKKIGQTGETSEIEFNEFEKDKRIYLQVDGEFLIVKKIKKVVIKHQETIKVLEKN